MKTTRFFLFHRLTLMSVFLSSMAGGTAFASHPLVTDDTGTQGNWSASIAVGAEVVKELTMVANVGAETNGDKGSDTWPAFLLGGFIYSVTENLDVDLGIKKGLNRPEANLAVLAGVAWRF